jgi:transposase-like protein
MPRPRGDTMIVAESEVEDLEAIRGLDWTFFKYCDCISTVQKAIIWCARHRLLANSRVCLCGTQCTLVNYGGHIDGKRWCCPSCKSTIFLRRGSFFERSHLPLNKLLMIIYFWSHRASLTFISEQLEISYRVCVDWYNFIRDICVRWNGDHKVAIGGLDDDITGRIVEIDETVIAKRKYNRGRLVKERWLFGGIDRESGMVFMVIVPNRRSETLLAILEKQVAFGSHIISDGFASYNGIQNIGGGIFSHSVIVHEENYVAQGEPLVHTQNIECLWSKLKSNFKRMRGCGECLLESHLEEFMWRNNFVKEADILSTICFCIAFYYPV